MQNQLFAESHPVPALDLLQTKPVKKMEARGYQIALANGGREALKDEPGSSVLLQLPVGGGKTIVASYIIDLAVKRGKRVLFLAERRDLIFQAQQKLTMFGIPSGAVISGSVMDLSFPVMVASLGTLRERVLRTGRIDIGQFDLVFIDEAHRAVAKTYLELRKEIFPTAYVVGLTATPHRHDGQALSMMFDKLVTGPSMDQLIEMGYLVPFTIYSPSLMDLTGVKSIDGDFDLKKIEEINFQNLVAHPLEHYLARFEDRKFFAYLPGLKSAYWFAKVFNEAKVKTGYVDGAMKRGKVDEARRILTDESFQGWANVDKLNEGTDKPSIKLIIDCSPTKSLTKYIQRLGRGTRPYDGYETCVVLDHAGNWWRHGDPRDIPEDFWTLDGKEMKRRISEREKAQPKPITCVRCGDTHRPTPLCPQCGYEAQKKQTEEGISFYEGQLGEVERLQKRRRKGEWTQEEKDNFYQGLRGYAASKVTGSGKPYSDGWVNLTYQEKFKEQATKEQKALAPKDPSLLVLNFIKHKNVKASFRYRKG